MTEQYLAAIVASLFGVNMAMVAWTFNKLERKVNVLTDEVAHLQRDVAVMIALGKDRMALIETMRDTLAKDTRFR